MHLSRVGRRRDLANLLGSCLLLTVHTSVRAFARRLVVARLSAHSRYRAPNRRRVLNRRRVQSIIAPCCRVHMLRGRGGGEPQRGAEYMNTFIACTSCRRSRLSLLYRIHCPTAGQSSGVAARGPRGVSRPLHQLLGRARTLSHAVRCDVVCCRCVRARHEWLCIF